MLVPWVRMRIALVLLAALLLGAGCDSSRGSPQDLRPSRDTALDVATPEAPAITTPAAVAEVPPLSQWPTWRGTWFDIKYPLGFAARAGKAGCIAGAGCDSASFRSPDGAVEFYVYSPLWGGDPSVDIAMDPGTERLIDKQEEVTAQRTVRWATVAAKDGSYTRSTVDIVDDNYGSPVRHAFGITYKDAATYAAWREAYLAFKGSLLQYAD
jgi:hypothetical protein